ncbi:protease complex subunit PrcB family protein [Candidatus Parcubacteria bacterium]|nr:protease complex subunit PrcB family protein [Candidatus Parcubacteria bacterium]
MRNIFVVVGIGVIAIVIWMVASTYGAGPLSTQTPSTPSSVAAVPVPFTELAHGMHSTVTARTNYLITSPSELLALWAMIDAPNQPPEVDFTRNDVIAVFAGNEPTAGYDIKVSQVKDSQSRMVTVLLTKPGANCLSPHAVTSPYQVIELSKTALSLAHQDQEDIVSCLQ